MNILIGLVRNKLVALILGPEGMGLVSLFNSTIRLVSDSTNFGLSLSAVRSISEAVEAGDAARLRQVIGTVRAWSLFTALLGMLLCAALSPWLSDWTFAWGDHKLHFVLLAPVVALLAITGTETAILKGGRHLKSLAVVSVCHMLFALGCSVLLFYFFGQSAIVPSILLMALTQCVLTVGFSYRLYPPSFRFSREQVGSGRNIIRLGLAFVVAGIFGSGAEFVLRSYLNNVGELDVVGLYNSGFVLTMTYVSIVFTSLETDYFPRLSAIRQLGAELNQTVNRQIEVSLLIVSPMLVVFMVSLPILLPILFSNQFLPMQGMMRLAVLAQFFRAVNLPIEYITLSRGDSRSYLLLEAVYYILFVGLTMLGWQWGGLTGTGAALLVCTVTNSALVITFTRYKYGFRLSAQVVAYMLIQALLGLLTCYFTFTLSGSAYWLACASTSLLSLWVSASILRSKTHLWSSLKKKVGRRFCKK